MPPADEELPANVSSLEQQSLAIGSTPYASTPYASTPYAGFNETQQELPSLAIGSTPHADPGTQFESAEDRKQRLLAFGRTDPPRKEIRTQGAQARGTR